MKKIILSLIFIFTFSSIAIAIEQKWLTLTENNKSIDVLLSKTKILSDKKENEFVLYFAKTKNKNDYYFSGIVAICFNDNESKAALISSIPISEHGQGNLSDRQDKDNWEFKKATGTIKLSNDYACNYYFNNLKMYENIVLNAENDFKTGNIQSAINNYNSALSEAVRLTDMGYSAKRQSDVLFALADIYKSQKKYKQAKECYQKIIDLDKIKDLSIKEEANNKLLELQEKKKKL